MSIRDKETSLCFSLCVVDNGRADDGIADEKYPFEVDKSTNGDMILSYVHIVAGRALKKTIEIAGDGK